MKTHDVAAAKSIKEVKIPIVDPQSPAPLAFERTYKYVLDNN